jgi:hypothetical protein
VQRPATVKTMRCGFRDKDSRIAVKIFAGRYGAAGKARSGLAGTEIQKLP